MQRRMHVEQSIPGLPCSCSPPGVLRLVQQRCPDNKTHRKSLLSDAFSLPPKIIGCIHLQPHRCLYTLRNRARARAAFCMPVREAIQECVRSRWAQGYLQGKLSTLSGQGTIFSNHTCRNTCASNGRHANQCSAYTLPIVQHERGGLGDSHTRFVQYNDGPITPPAIKFSRCPSLPPRPLLPLRIITDDVHCALCFVGSLGALSTLLATGSLPCSHSNTACLQRKGRS